ncbi:MAG TPA: CHAT domain-containing protein [Pyrinomonadaceae bacterium]|nr:CHAT domain-containing protein [Pyrinomonadaceae bacterium]
MSCKSDERPRARGRGSRPRAAAALAAAVLLQLACLAAARANAAAGGDAFAAERAVAEGRELFEGWTEVSLRGAAAKFEEARAASRAAGDPGGEAAAANLAGEVYFTLSEYARSLDSYRAALGPARAARDRAAEVEALNGVANVLVYLGRGREAAAYCRRALDLSRAAGDTRGEARSLANTGAALYFEGDMRGAEESLTRALALWPKGDGRGKVQALLDLGYVRYDLRDVDGALGHYDQALQLSRASNYRRGEALALTAAGSVEAYLGKRQAALASHNRAARLFREMGERNGEAVASNGLGYVYRSLGEYARALECYDRARRLFAALGNREYETFTLTRVGNSYQGLGEHERALECYRETLRRSVRYPQTRANALNLIGTVYAETGETRLALENFGRALALYRSVRDRMGEAGVLANIGGAHESAGRREKALEHYRLALALSRATSDRAGEVSALFRLAGALRDAGDLEGALAQMEASLSLVESLRTQVLSRDLGASYSASVHRHYELYIDLLMRLDRRDPARGHAARALQASERARARGLFDTLTDFRDDIRRGAPPALLDKAHALNLALERVQERRARLSAGDDEQAAALSAEAQSLASELEEVESRMREESPAYAALVRPQSLGLEEIQREVLADGETALLEFSLGDSASYLWAVTKDGMTWRELPARAEIERAVRSAYELLTARHRRPEGESAAAFEARVAAADAEYWRQAAALSELILGPVAGELKAKRLLVVADGALQYVPFAALPLPHGAPRPAQAAAAIADNGDTVPLVVTHEIVNLPSASIQAALRKETARRRSAEGSVAVLADPVFESDDGRLLKASGGEGEVKTVPAALASSQVDAPLSSGRSFSRLPHSRDEAEAIAAAASSGRVLKALGFDASRAAALGPELGRHRFVHFATHGVVDSERPELSRLVFSLFDERGRPRDGSLLLGDIYNMDLPVEMVVLSACETGLGKDIKGEGLIGLTRGFMHAGASSVVASLWTIDDGATAELMKIFYERVLSGRVSRAGALREAQVQMWGQKRWRAPYFWAAFVMHGDYGSPSAAAPPSGRSLAFVAAAALAAAALGGILAARRLRARRRAAAVS